MLLRQVGRIDVQHDGAGIGLVDSRRNGQLSVGAGRERERERDGEGGGGVRGQRLETAMRKVCGHG
jgi:hypothetical protein